MPVLKALILVGGYGTRLRPLTLSKPKPLVEFANKPIVLHQVEAMARIGVSEIVFAVSYRSEAFVEAMSKKSEELNIKMVFSQEDEPLGTAGPLALAKEHLKDCDAFFVLNSDVICDFVFAELLQFHSNHGKEGTILVTRVKDPSKYGVVISDDDGRISAFVEKPKEFVGDCINAGMYVFKPSILDRIEAKPTSIEREIFPAIVNDGELYSMVLPGFWMDVGQPKDYLLGLHLYLEFLASSGHSLSSGEGFVGNVLVHPSAKIGKGSLIGPDVTIGPNVVIEDGVRIQNAAIFEDVRVGTGAFIRRSIIGWKSSIGRWSRVQDGVVLGEDVQVGDGVFLHGVQVLPHKGLKEDELQPRVIM